MADEPYLWRIHTSTDTIYADYAQHSLGDTPITRGETASFEFHFQDPATEPLVVPSGTTYTIPAGTTEIWPSVDVQGTLDVQGSLILTEGDDFVDLRSLSEHAGSYSPLPSIQNEYKIRQQKPSTAPSLIVGIEPSQDLKDEDVPGVWGVVDAGTDTRENTYSEYVFSLDVTVLNTLDEYADQDSAETSLAVTY